MTTDVAGRWPLAYATRVAGELKALLAPACERIEEAGSVRRRRETVKDIELVVIPKVDISMDMFKRESASVSRLDALLETLMQEGVLDKRPDIHGHFTYGPKNKYLLHVPSGIALDIFATTVAYWGMSYLVRTGPKDWNIKVMSRFQQLGCQGHSYAGYTDQSGQEHDCPDEADVFAALGWPWIAPEARA